MSSNQDPTTAYVGLDLSLTSTGIAVIAPERTAISRVITKPGADTSSMKVRRLEMIVGHIQAAIPFSTPRVVVAMEGPAFASNSPGAHMRGGLWWMVRSMLADSDAETLVIPPKSVKKYATGKGNAQKDAVLAAVIRRYLDVDVTGNDEADALVLAAMAARHDGHPIEASLPQVNLEAMTGIGR